MTQFRDYCNDHPACRAATQMEHLTGQVYREVKGGGAFEALVRSLRKGDTVRVFRPFLLAPKAGTPGQRRRAWARRAEQIKARGACLRSIDPELKGAVLAMYAYEEIGKVAKGRAGKGKKGRPRKGYSEEAIRVIERFWPPRKGWTVEQCVDEINGIIKPRKVTRGWLYIRYPIKAD